MLSARKGSCLISRPFHTYLWLISSRPRKNPRSSRSSFLMHHTSACPYTPVGTTRNTSHTLLRSSKSSNRRGCPRSAECCQGYCEIVRGVKESPRSHGFSRHHLDERRWTARVVEIEQTQQMLQEAQKAHNKAIAESYEQLRNLLSGDAQS